MPKICYRSRKFRGPSLDIIDTANEILRDYVAQGFDLTLRQLYYQFVARGYMENTQKSYNRLGDVVDKARLAGLIDWDHIEDRTRNLQSQGSWQSPADIIGSAAYSFHLDRWANQDCRIEVWCEKEALIGIFAEVCNKWNLPYFACRGYVSQSEMWRASLRLQKYARDGKQPIILHFGDHDPSGIDMTRDIDDRLAMFQQPSEIKRLALNMDQVEEYSPPPNPAKSTDARFATYVVEYGEESWELDALEPNTLIQLVEDQVHKYRDPEKWREVVDEEQEGKAQLQVLSDHWSDVTERLEEDHADDLLEVKDTLVNEDEYIDELDDSDDI